MSICRLTLLVIVILTPIATATVAPPAPPPTTPPPPVTTRPVEEIHTPTAVAIGSVLVALAAVFAWFAGVFRPGSIHGPTRLGAGSPVVPILLILLIGGACWIGAQVVIYSVRGYQHARETGGERMTMSDLRPEDLGLIATVPAVAAMLIMLAADLMFGLLRPIGLTLARLPKRLLVGFGAGLLALLLMQGAGLLVAAFYELIRYEHPSEHELLGAMKDASPAAKMMLVLGACVVAPLFEELLFRGHMQTLLTRLFTPRPPVQALSPLPPMQFTTNTFGTPASGALPNGSPPLPVSVDPAWVPAAPAAPAEASEPARGMPWLAVIITSFVFASIHPLWTAPLIFLLSLCLGYAYERSGNLWVPIVMHALFNTSSTVVFLLSM